MTTQAVRADGPSSSSSILKVALPYGCIVVPVAQEHPIQHHVYRSLANWIRASAPQPLPKTDSASASIVDGARQSPPGVVSSIVVVSERRHRWPAQSIGVRTIRGAHRTVVKRR